MKSRIRKRYVFKWVGLALNTAFMLTFAASLRYGGGVMYEGYKVSVGYGCILVSGREASREFRYGFRTMRATFIRSRIPQFETAGGGFGLIVPVWVPLLLTAVATVWLWRWDRRPPDGCLHCGYNLTGNVSGVCPECGVPNSRHTAELS